MLWYANTLAQNDSIQRLETVVLVADTYVKENTIGQKKTIISKESYQNNATNPTETLRFNSTIAIRDYGNGGTSSARFRGTNASNTAVVWNGININALGNGQTGLNSLSLAISDEVLVKSGGGSAKYGSGAIGGSVHLNDVLLFKNHINGNVFSSYGSFNTTSNVVSVNTGTKKWALKLASTYNKSQNDYPYVDPRYPNTKNENGAYENYGISASVGYRFSKNNTLSFYTTGYYGDRLFSGVSSNTNTSSLNDRYVDLNQRNLLVWSFKKKNFHHQLKGAFLTQEYRFFDDKNSEDFDYGESDSYVVNYDLKYRLTEKTSLNTFVDLQHIYGGTNKVSKKKREQYSFLLGLKTVPFLNYKIQLEAKKEFNSAFKVPLVFSLGNEYRLNDMNHLLLNISTNYRVPSLNDLYWPGQGNKDLIPETSKQIDIGYEYQHQHILLKSFFFFIDVEDKIVWTPNGDSSRLGVWVPINLDRSHHKGLELEGRYAKDFKKLQIGATGNYIYTVAQNTKTKTDLIFVPRHLFNATIHAQLNQNKIYLQSLHQSKVYTSEDNIDVLSLKGFAVYNIGFERVLLQTKKTNIELGFVVKNIWNQLYQFSNLRPMPGRNYTLNINYKF